MLEITINNDKKVYQITQILHNLKNISSELNLLCDENGLYAQGMDSSHVCLFELNIKPGWFDTYNCSQECVMGIHCEMLFKIISCIKEGQHIDMKHDPVNSASKLTINLLGNSYDKSFELSLIDIESDMVELPEKEYTADIKFVSKDYAELVNQLSIFGDRLKIKCDDEIVLNSENERLVLTTCWPFRRRGTRHHVWHSIYNYDYKILKSKQRDRNSYIKWISYKNGV